MVETIVIMRLLYIPKVVNDKDHILLSGKKDLYPLSKTLFLATYLTS